MFRFHSRFILIAIFPFAFACNNNNGNNQKRAGKILPEYSFPVPEKWKTEKFAFPIVFAPQIPYKGFEDLRFAPGWEFTDNEQHWTYAFLWWLDGSVAISDTILQDHLKDYYTGLIGTNAKQNTIPVDKVIPVKTDIKKIDTDAGDIDTYRGTITMTNYLDFTYNSITLNCEVHKKNCGSHTAILFLLSPKPYGHITWQELKKVKEGFTCK